MTRIEPELVAGSLDHSTIGRRIKVRVESGAIVEDELTMIHYGSSSRSADSDHTPYDVWLQFAHVHPNTLTFDTQLSTGFFTTVDTEVHIIN